MINREKFTPSDDLVKLVEENMVPPDEETLVLIKELMKMEGISMSQKAYKERLAELISEEVEALMTSLAKESSHSNKSAEISKDNGFTREVCSDLVNRLGLDVCNSRIVLDTVYAELVAFISASPRERKWGKILFENGKPKLLVKKDAFKTIDIDKIDKRNWVKL